jgi:Ca2+-transporting ATPase
MATYWHIESRADLLKKFKSSEQGLTPAQVKENLATYGTNSLPEGKTDSLFIIFLRQFQSPLTYVLLIASVIIFLIQEYTDAGIILFILIFNAVVGTIQEGRAQNTLASLKKFIETRATVLRGGLEEIVPDTHIVPGDILILEEGEKVAGDARLIEASGLLIDESTLTGESEPVEKNPAALRHVDLPIADQINMVFKGTNVLSGSGKALVVATGISSVIGSISNTIAHIESEDPLKKDFRQLSKFIIMLALGICGGVFILGLIVGNPLKEMFTVVVSLAVSIIPEGLPIVLTLVLATGVWRMSKRNALIKKLQAVESLGQAKIIAVDKTGTLTKNELAVQRVYTGGIMYEVTGNGYEGEGQIFLDKKTISPAGHEALQRIARLSGLSANGRAVFSEEKQIWQVHGDPTEAALVAFAEKVDGNPNEQAQKTPRIAELPFSYQTKYHAVLNETEKGPELTIVGASEEVLKKVENEWSEQRQKPLTPERRREIERQIESLSKDGFRVLAVAAKEHEQKVVTHEAVNKLTLVGLIGMRDVLRPEAKEALLRAREAGIKVIMITGDHQLTAQAIAEEVGIFSPGDTVLSGAELEQLNDNELAHRLSTVSVFARVTPEHKMRIIQAYKARKEIIAMTGDGVNDAPSLMAADLGVAMGKIGTEVAKEAADIILLDDNFGSIVAAVEEGRNIYKTIKKVILYLVSTGLGEALTIAFALIAGLPLPLVAVQIIWLNFVTDGFLDVSLAMEPKEPGLLTQPYNKESNTLIDHHMKFRILTMALTMALGSLWMFSHYHNGDIIKAWSITMTTLAVFQWFNAWNCRHDTASIFQLNPFQNKYLIAATLTVATLQLFALYNPLFQRILKTTGLNWQEWALIFGVSLSVIVVEEIRKFIYRRRLVAAS